MLPAILGAALVVTASAAGSGADFGSGSAAGEASVLARDPYRLEAFLHDLPSAGTTSALLEMVIHPATPLTEDAGGFGALDPERVSLLGESWTWTRWRIDGHDVTSALVPGSAALHLPFAWTKALELSMGSRVGEHQGSGIDALPDYGVRGVQAGLRTVIPSLGGIAPGAIGLMNAISGTHGFERGVPPPDERRRYRSLFGAWATGGLELGGGVLTAGVEITDATRRFLDFDSLTGGLRRTVDEPGSRLSAGISWASPSGDRRVLLLAEHTDRDNLGLEAGLSQDESMARDADAFLVALRAGRARLSLKLERASLVATERSATRELHDVDGEAASPWQPDGEQVALSASAGWDHGAFYATVDEAVVWSTPHSRSWVNRLVFHGAPYGRIDWAADETAVAVGELRLGHADGVELGAGWRLDWDLYGWAAHAVNGRGDNGLLQVDLGADLTATTRWGSVTPFVLVSKSPIAPTTQTALALAPRYLEGALTVGGTLLDTWGGSRTTVDGNLRPTNVYTGAVGFGWDFSAGWTFRAQGLVKSLDETLWMEGGRYFVEDGLSYLAPGEQRYVLTNLDRDAPVYFGGQLQVLGLADDDHLVNFSFAVYNVVGRTPPGNGPLANDPGVLDRATANPTARIDELANLDTDRAFLTKIVLGKRLVERLWGFMSIRHRDGQPFAFLEPRQSARTGQVVMVPDSPRGSPFVYQRPLAGPREDFRLDFDVELSWTRALGDGELRVSALVANILDMGNELSEVQVLPARSGRGSLEAQIPRSLVLSVALSTP